MLYPCESIPSPPTPPPPSYSAANSSGFNNGRQNRAGGVRPSDNKPKASFAQRVRDLFRTGNKNNSNNSSQPSPQGETILRTETLEITVHDTTPNITEVVAVTCDEKRRRVTVDVKVSASVTARSRSRRGHGAPGGGGGRPAVPTEWLVKRSAQARFRRSRGGKVRSVAVATERATRDAAAEAHERALTLATMSAAAKALGEVAAQARGV